MSTLNDTVKSIHLRDNIYVCVLHEKATEYDNNMNGASSQVKEVHKEWAKQINSDSIGGGNSQYLHYSIEGHLFGGRLFYNRQYENFNEIKIDGIQLYSMEDGNFQNEFSFEETTAIFNAIATHGVDAFLKNYQDTLKSYLEYFENRLQVEQANALNEVEKESQKLIAKIKTVLSKILSLLFVIQMHMTLSIENETIQSVYYQIIAQFS
jgi:hypothetical protein